MKVCFVVGTLARGGAEKQLVFMLRALKNAGVAAEIVCLTRGEAYESEIRDAGFPIEWVGESRNHLARLWKITAKLRRVRADIVQSSHFYANLYAALAGKFARVPSVGAVRSDLTYEIKSHPISGRWQIELPDVLLVNSGAARRRLIERGIAPEKIEYVRNAVEIEETEQEKNVERPALKILFVGRLDENKRPDKFVRLAAVLHANLPRIPMLFLVAGDGKLRAKLEKMADELGLTPDKLKFLGDCPKMSEIYRDADVLISTSDSEGTPNVVLEAMAHAVPVVATRVGGTAEILDSNRGFLIAPGEERELISAAEKLIASHELRRRLGANGRRYVRENHSLDYLQKHLTGIYQSLTVPAINRKDCVETNFL